MNAETLDMQFDEGTDVIDALDLSKAKRINVDFPTKMIDSLDREAGRLGVTRQSIIKVWLAERLESTAANLPPQHERR